MNSDWVKRRGKSLHRIWHSLKTEEKELAAKGIIISFENAKNEIQKLLDEVEKIQADE
jgi:hypothetical protein